MILSCGILRQSICSPLEKFARAADWKKQFGIICSGIWKQQSSPRISKIHTGHGVAVGPSRIGAQVKCPCLCIRRSFPACRNRWSRKASLRIVRAESIEERSRDTQILHVTHPLRIESENITACEFDFCRKARGIESQQRASQHDGRDDQEKGDDPAHRRREYAFKKWARDYFFAGGEGGVAGLPVAPPEALPLPPKKVF